MATLTIQLPGLPPVEHVLRDEAITIGRMRGNTIALEDSSVSLSHAKLTRFGDDYVLKDLNSTNGTMLNGQSINEARLHDGDRVQFGEVVACFRLELAAPVPPAKADSPKPAAQTMLAATPTAKSAASAVPPQTAPAPSGAARPRSQNKSPWMIVVPVIGAIAVIGTIGFALWSMFGDKQSQSATPAPSISAAHPPPAPTNISDDRKPEAGPLRDLLTALAAPEPNARRKAANTIYSSESVPANHLPALRSALQDADPETQMWAALALVKNQSYDPAAIPILIRVLRHESPSLRQVACISLALFPYNASERTVVVAALKQVAEEDASPAVRGDARIALDFLDGGSVQNQLKENPRLPER